MNVNNTKKAYQTFRSYFLVQQQNSVKNIQSCTEKQINVTLQRLVNFINEVKNETFGLIGKLVFIFYMQFMSKVKCKMQE